MAGAVRDMNDLIPIGTGLGYPLIKQIADGQHHLQIPLLVVTTDIVGLTDLPFRQHQAKGTGVVFHIEPVTDLVALAI
ncbi:hypothetical protein D3C81_956490 [compost metagenome]